MIQQLNSILARYREQPGPLLLVLHAIQDEFGYIPDAAVPVVAAGLNLSRAEVHGVVTFYHYFRHTPPGKQVVQLCRAEACQAMQAEQLAAHVQTRLGIGFNQTTADGQFTLQPVYCLGNCACAPSMMIGGELYGRVTPACFDAVLQEKGQS